MFKTTWIFCIWTVTSSLFSLLPPIITLVSSGREAKFTCKSMVAQEQGSLAAQLICCGLSPVVSVCQLPEDMPTGKRRREAWTHPQGCLEALGATDPERQAGANELVSILFCRSGLDLGQKYPEENFSRPERTLYRQNVVFASLSQVLGKVKRIPGNWRVWTLEL